MVVNTKIGYVYSVCIYMEESSYCYTISVHDSEEMYFFNFFFDVSEEWNSYAWNGKWGNHNDKYILDLYRIGMIKRPL